jgi:hypothetical protein
MHIAQKNDANVIVQFMLDKNMIVNTTPTCNTCKVDMRWVTRKTNTCFAWRCKKCLTYMSIKNNCFISKFDFPIVKVLKLIYAWCEETSVSTASQKYSLSHSTVVKFYKLLRRVACTAHKIDKSLLGSDRRDR